MEESGKVSVSKYIILRCLAAFDRSKNEKNVQSIQHLSEKEEGEGVKNKLEKGENEKTFDISLRFS